MDIVYGLGWHEELARDRIAGARAAAEERRLAKLVAGSPPLARLRARAARKLFEFAVAVEREAAWRAVWDKLEAPGRFREKRE